MTTGDRFVSGVASEPFAASAPAGDAVASEAETLREGIGRLHRVWFTGADLDKDLVAQEAISLFRLAAETRRMPPGPSEPSPSSLVSADDLRKEISESWQMLESFGFPPEASGYPFQDIRGELPHAIEAAMDCIVRQRDEAQLAVRPDCSGCKSAGVGVQESACIEGAVTAESANAKSGRKRDWRSSGELPEVELRNMKEYIVAVFRAHSGKTYTFAATYLNGYRLNYEWGCPKNDSDLTCDGCEDGCPTTGWFVQTGEEDDGTTFHTLGLKDGDEIKGWCELPTWEVAETHRTESAGSAPPAVFSAPTPPVESN